MNIDYNKILNRNMINVFKAISVFGTSDAQALATGISEALITV